MATQVVNASLGTTPYRVTLGDDSHQWLSDVPAALGGADSGPSPHEILLSASPWRCTRSARSGRWRVSTCN